MNIVREISVEESKSLMLEILADFHKVCEENNLRYSLAFGTLLGAVRHNGFIPWDDDIDVVMPRDDYKRFIKIANEKLNRNHKLISIETEKRFTAPLAKIIDTNTVLHQLGHAAEKIDLGVFIDIFVNDLVPNNKFYRSIKYSLSAFFQRCWTICEYKYNKNLFFIRLLRMILNYSLFARFFSSLLKINALFGTKSKSKTYSELMFGIHYDRKFYEYPAEKFDDLIDVQFEDYRFKAFKDYEFFLSKWYGDYMELPPEDKRIAHHNLKMYLK